ncbi:solute symporter family protein [Paenibacillus tarimensis]|uniref:solute symporter family protein n=1 Tax=Paenibacillus tarimensis TaxID=416012 RepID=UPI001F2B3FED|nr:cation acetate symporter [Paenibacillus tarimensis]MCF2943022.1 cation acetate symporter [Paenibacillus tarimensis]
MLNTYAIMMVLTLIIITIVISLVTRKFNSSTANFYLAGRKVGMLTNSTAICGDYFSAASFLGVAAAVYASGVDGMWYAIGFGAAFVPVVLFLASPLRKFGEYTIPDFLFARFGRSHVARIIGVVMVQLICIFYLAPQMVGAGNTWNVLVGVGFLGMSPYQTGVVAVVIIMMFYVAVGGMKGTTLNQMIQFWVLFTAMFIVFALILINGVGSYASERVPLVNPSTMTVAKLMEGEEGSRPYDQAREVMSPEAFAVVEAAVQKGDPGATVNVVLPQTNKLHPERTMIFQEPGHRYDWLNQFSMVLALVLGTMGLPHIMNRYYTNPSGKSARLTTLWVLGFIGFFYIMSSVAGMGGRKYVSELAGSDPSITGLTVDGLLLKSDQIMPVLGKLLFGEFGLGYVAAGAFAAMFSTVGGLLIASAASWGHDIYENYVNPNAPEWKKVLVGKIAVVVMGLFSLFVGIGIPAIGLDKAYPSLIAMMVTWAFAISGGAFVPMLLCSIWWKKTTRNGAIAGMLVGGGGSILFIGLNILKETGVFPAGSFGAVLGSLAFPSIFIIPLSFAVIVMVSLFGRQGQPAYVNSIWARIHGTDALSERVRLAMQEADKRPAG